MSLNDEIRSESKQEWLKKLIQLAEDTCIREKCKLYELVWVGGSKGKGRIVRVYVDRFDQPVSIADCENVSRALGLLLEVEDIIPGGEYDLEVSTPGLERKLTQPWHYSGAIGQLIHVKTHEDLNPFSEKWSQNASVKRHNAKGRVVSVSDTAFVLEVDGNEVSVPFSIVEKAQVVFDFENSKGKKK